MNGDLTAQLRDRVRAAAADAVPLAIEGHGTKSFLGRVSVGEPLTVAGHVGILSYEPKELVMRARAGTTLAEIEAALREHDQTLPFEPPHFALASSGLAATLGGTIACGLSGPARSHAGAARDLVLGIRVLTGRAEVLHFGGDVMKNVAGYDVSRLMVGALGTLGILLEISLRVMPRPLATVTRSMELSIDAALARMTAWAAQPLPITATCFDGTRLWVRLCGTGPGVSAAAGRIGGDPVEGAEADAFWGTLIREQQHPFFQGGLPLWRLSLPPACPALDLPGVQLIEWGGAQRWLTTDAAVDAIRAPVATRGGHATLFRGGDRTGQVFSPPSAALMALHRQVKLAFDPLGILNPGRLFADF